MAYPRFLENFPPGNVAIFFNFTPTKREASQNGILVRNLNHDILRKRCALFTSAFEDGNSGNACLELNTESLLAAEGLLRYLYTGDYEKCINPSFGVEQSALGSPGPAIIEDPAAQIEQGAEDAEDAEDDDDYDDAGFPNLLSLHVEMCRMGFILGMKPLQQMARWRVLASLEESCNYPHPPPGLWEAIRLVYRSSVLQKDTVKDSLLSYCVDQFLQHHLADNESFRDLVFTLPNFASDLCLCCRLRDFDVDAAADIIKLPCPGDVIALSDDDDSSGKEEEEVEEETFIITQFPPIYIHLSSNSDLRQNIM